jgi:hypothetical protein
MNNYLMRRDGEITGPFTIADLKKMIIRPSDRFALENDELEWICANEIEELNQLYFIHGTQTMQLSLPAGNAKKPQKWTFRRMFTGNEFRISFIKFLNNIQTARVAALFVIMLISTLFVKATLDTLVSDNFAYMQSAVMHPPVAEGLKAGKNFHNAIVKSFIDPASSQTKFHKPARPKDVFKLVQVVGKTFPAEGKHPNSILITVKNNSVNIVDNAEIEVLYETKGKPFIEKYQFKYLSPLGSKTMSVPLSRQNVNVKYRVLNIYTSQYTSLQREV